ncbi:large ribosomal subunit protein mL40-like [Liolophura sinensis]|uniref:large ribosomal subunit protein mL40-like n=1 Tax=Liolophura sinensis TaxID=3198878 RepID=UPI003158BA20
MSALLQTALNQLSRLRLTGVCVQGVRKVHTNCGPLSFQASSVLWTSPMKKKKKVDPQLLIAKEQKKKRRIEKQIRRLEKFSRKLKPVDEISGDIKLRKELEFRKRDRPVLTFEESERRALLQKEWTRYKYHQYGDECEAISRLILSQEKALEELRKESEELYQQAIQIDENLIPYECEGPVATPPIEDYKSPDGEYKDTTKKY